MKRTLIVAALLVAVAGPMTAKVYVDFDVAADFSRYKTYAIGQGTAAPNELSQKRIEAGLRAQLELEGLTEVKKGDADLLVLTHAGSDKQRKQRGGNLNVGVSKRGKHGSVGVSSGGGRRSTVVDTGTLIIELVDNNKDELVWQASITEALKDPEKMEKKLDKALAEAFAKYPPK